MAWFDSDFKRIVDDDEPMNNDPLVYPTTPLTMPPGLTFVVLLVRESPNAEPECIRMRDVEYHFVDDQFILICRNDYALYTRAYMLTMHDVRFFTDGKRTMYVEMVRR